MLQDRLQHSPATSPLVATGMAIRGSLGLPFWDSLIIACFGAGVPAVPVLEQASFHNLAPVRARTLSANTWSTEIEAELKSVGDEEMTVVSSRIVLRNGERKHIPMLDFHAPPSPQNEECVRFIAKRLDPNGGFVLVSGKSYHFYGKSLLAEDQLSSFLGKALLFSPFVDRAWIAHQLIEGACGLRISKKKIGSATPALICEF